MKFWKSLITGILNTGQSDTYFTWNCILMTNISEYVYLILISFFFEDSK